MDEVDVVLAGYWVEIELIDQDDAKEPMRIQIVPDAYADLARGYLGESTPLCQAIFGQPVGAEIEYQMGELRAVRILALTPAEDGPDPRIKVRREETLRRAKEESDRTNAILFASSFNGKWGDYDPAGLMDEAKGNDQDDVAAEEKG